MADTFDSRLKLRLQESGGNSGQWGTLLNQTVTNIASVFGYGTHQLTSDANATLTLSDDGASLDALKSSYLKITSSVSLTATRTLTFAPNTFNQVKYIENATTGSQSLVIKQGSGATVTVASGKTAVLYFTGSGSDAAVVDALAGVDPGVTDTLAEVLASGNATGGTDIAVGTGDDVTFADSSKAIFGAGSDLQIYHDGSNSWVSDQGTGQLILESGGAGVYIQKGATETMANFVADGSVSLYYDNGKKFETTASGIDVTGSVTAAGLTSSASIQTTGSSSYFISNSSSSGDYIRLYAGSGTGKWDIYGNGANLRIGDNDSAGAVHIDTNVGIGTSSPQAKLHSYTSGTGSIPTGQFNQTSDANTALTLINANNSATYSAIKLETREAQAAGWMIANEFQSAFNGDLVFRGRDGGTSSAEVLRLKSNGNVGIGASSPDQKLVVESAADTQIKIVSGASNDAYLTFYNGTSLNHYFKQDNTGLFELYYYDGSAANSRIQVNPNGGLYVGTTGSSIGSGNIVVNEGIYVGAANGDNQIRSSSAGGGSATLYIGNAAIQSASDQRLKTNIVDTEMDALEKVNQVRVVDFNWDDPSDTSFNNRNARGKWTGVLAQELVDVLPFAVNAPRNESDLSIDTDSEQRWLVDQDQMVPVLIKAIQEQQTLIESLTDRIATLEQ